MNQYENFQISGINAAIKGLEVKFGALEKDFTELKGEVKELSKNVSALNKTAWTVSSGVVVVAALGLMFGNAYIRGQAREEIRAESQSRQTAIQTGTFNLQNRVQGTDNQFVWKLQQPVDPSSVISMIVRPVDAMGIGLKAELIEDGKKCRMTVLVDDPAKIAGMLPIKATIEIVYRIES